MKKPSVLISSLILMHCAPAATASSGSSTLEAQRSHVIHQYLYDLENANLKDMISLFTKEGWVISTSKSKINAKDFFSDFLPSIKSAKTVFHQEMLSVDNTEHYAVRFHFEFKLKNGENRQGEYMDEFVFAQNSSRLNQVYLFENPHFPSEGLGEKEKTLENGPISNTYGYDIHYVILDDEKKEATALKEEVIQFIQSQITSDTPVYLAGTYQTDKPMGPWHKPVWEIKLATVPENTDPSNPNALDKEKLYSTHQLMKKTVQFTESALVRHQLKGSLLVHANTWPENSNQLFEHALHFKHAWLVSGEKSYLKDIWSEKGGLIEQEKFIIKQIQKNTPLDQILIKFKEKFHMQNPEKTATMLMNAQENLQKMHENANELNGSF